MDICVIQAVLGDLFESNLLLVAVALNQALVARESTLLKDMIGTVYCGVNGRSFTTI